MDSYVDRPWFSSSSRQGIKKKEVRAAPRFYQSILPPSALSLALAYEVGHAGSLPTRADVPANGRPLARSGGNLRPGNTISIVALTGEDQREARSETPQLARLATAGERN